MDRDIEAPWVTTYYTKYRNDYYGITEEEEEEDEDDDERRERIYQSRSYSFL